MGDVKKTRDQLREEFLRDQISGLNEKGYLSVSMKDIKNPSKYVENGVVTRDKVLSLYMNDLIKKNPEKGMQILDDTKKDFYSKPTDYAEYEEGKKKYKRDTTTALALGAGAGGALIPVSIASDIGLRGGLKTLAKHSLIGAGIGTGVGAGLGYLSTKSPKGKLMADDAGIKSALDRRNRNIMETAENIVLASEIFEEFVKLAEESPEEAEKLAMEILASEEGKSFKQNLRDTPIEDFIGMGISSGALGSAAMAAEYDASASGLVRSGLKGGLVGGAAGLTAGAAIKALLKDEEKTASENNENKTPVMPMVGAGLAAGAGVGAFKNKEMIGNIQTSNKAINVAKEAVKANAASQATNAEDMAKATSPLAKGTLDAKAVKLEQMGDELGNTLKAAKGQRLTEVGALAKGMGKKMAIGGGVGLAAAGGMAAINHFRNQGEKTASEVYEEFMKIAQESPEDAEKLAAEILREE